MDKRVAASFDMQGVIVAVDRILPLKTVPNDPKKSTALKRVMCSIAQVGLIEPLIIFPQAGGQGRYTLLDGHLRLEAIKQLKWTEVSCLISSDDESYTYNHKVNVVPPLQEHFMIIKAIENGVSEAKIAASLNVDISTIRQKRDLLNGICPEVVELLRDKRSSRDMFRVMRRAKPIRQIEMAELMIATATFTTAYAKCLIAATADELLLDPTENKALPGINPEDSARVEREMQKLEQDFRAIEESHAKNVMNLVLTAGYLRKILGNSQVNRFLATKYRDMHSELQKLVESTSLER